MKYCARQTTVGATGSSHHRSTITSIVAPVHSRCLVFVNCVVWCACGLYKLLSCCASRRENKRSSLNRKTYPACQARCKPPPAPFGPEESTGQSRSQQHAANRFFLVATPKPAVSRAFTLAVKSSKVRYGLSTLCSLNIPHTCLLWKLLSLQGKLLLQPCLQFSLQLVYNLGVKHKLRQPAPLFCQTKQQPHNSQGLHL